MSSRLEHLSKRERLILIGLYLSKYDSAGLNALGFETFAEAYNGFGYALAARPSSLKNYRDEFDPHFPNSRHGWHKRQLRNHCREILDRFVQFDFEELTSLVKSLVSADMQTTDEVVDRESGDPNGFAKRLITGLAAENYFETVHKTLPEFQGFKAENTTRLGCGYDFLLRPPTGEETCFVEVKGLRNAHGTISLTQKEYDAAMNWNTRFFLFVVKNFQKRPYHEIYQNPAASPLRFSRTETVVVQVSWSSPV
jgi:hypothetical protein